MKQTTEQTLRGFAVGDKVSVPGTIVRFSHAFGDKWTALVRLSEGGTADTDLVHATLIKRRPLQVGDEIWRPADGAGVIRAILDQLAWVRWHDSAAAPTEAIVPVTSLFRADDEPTLPP